MTAGLSWQGRDWHSFVHPHPLGLRACPSCFPNKQLGSASPVADTVLRATAFMGKMGFYSHFTDEEAEAQRGYWVHGHISGMWGSWNLSQSVSIVWVLNHYPALPLSGPVSGYSSLVFPPKNSHVASASELNNWAVSIRLCLCLYYSMLSPWQIKDVSQVLCP